MPPDLRPTLHGRLVTLEPLEEDHLRELWTFALDPALWTYGVLPVRDADDLRGYLGQAVRLRDEGVAVPFVVRLGGRVVGSTRFAAISWFDRRAEVGWTFYDPAVQGTAVNADTKRALLAHAFETWDLLRVEFKADARNERSRRALDAIGATYEGTLRQHMRTASQGQRDTVYYSILAAEWPTVRARLDARIDSRIDRTPGALSS